MAKILVEESLIEASTLIAEQSKIYFDALVKIMRSDPQTDEGFELRKIAVSALNHAQDISDLSAQNIEV